jgi:DNA polymerase I-like protein with 3'-5' exonuclease and polymerase domains
MSKIPLQNIPIRTDLGAKLRKLIRDQRPMPRSVAAFDFGSLEAAIAERSKEKP